MSGRSPQASGSLIAWAVLFGLWFLYAGRADLHEVGVGAIAAVIAVGIEIVVLRQRPVRFHPRIVALTKLWRLPVRMVVDFGSVMRALADRVLRRRTVRGSFDRVPAAGRGRVGGAVAGRVLSIIAGSFAPNTYVIELPPGGRTALVHRLVRRANEGPLIPGT